MNIPDNITVPLGRQSVYGTLEVPVGKFPPHVLDYVFNYGLKQVLNDAMADKKDDDGNPLSADLIRAKAEKRLDKCDVLVSDIGLPDGDGCELMQRFRARGGQVGIAITGFGQEEDIRRSAEAGFAQHLVKPIAIPVLFDALRNARDSVSLV